MADIEDAKSRKPTRDGEGSIFYRMEDRSLGNGKYRKEKVYYARVRYTDEKGKNRERKRRANSYDDAKTVRRQLQDEIKAEQEKAKENKPEEPKPEPPKTFNDLADYFSAEYVKEAVFVEDKKVEGFKEDLGNVRRQVADLKEAFGAMLLADITYEDIRSFKNKLYAKPVVREVWKTYQEFENGELVNKPIKAEEITQRKISSVHRVLARLRRILNIGVRKGWLAKNPFTDGEPLIQTSLETERVRILSFEEEAELFHVCTGKRKHLRAILIFALDTFMRKGEIFKTTWADVDFNNRSIFVKSQITKTEKSRLVPISGRLLRELKKLEPKGEYNKLLRVFGIEFDSDRAFYSALEKTGIEDFHFHDLRGTGITRMLRAGASPAEVMKFSGHTQWKTFLRYVKQDVLGTAFAASMLDNYLNFERSQVKPMPLVTAPKMSPQEVKEKLWLSQSATLNALHNPRKFNKSNSEVRMK